MNFKIAWIIEIFTLEFFFDAFYLLSCFSFIISRLFNNIYIFWFYFHYTLFELFYVINLASKNFHMRINKVQATRFML